MSSRKLIASHFL